MDDEGDARKAILHFLSAEINAHASMIIGFSVILFAFLDVVVKRLEPVYFPLYPTWASLQYILVFLILTIEVFLLLFVVFRLLFYGVFTHRTIHYERPADSFAQLWDGIANEIVDEKVWWVFRVRWFASGLARPTRGAVLLCMGLSVLASLSLAFTFLIRF